MGGLNSQPQQLNYVDAGGFKSQGKIVERNKGFSCELTTEVWKESTSNPRRNSGTWEIKKKKKSLTVKIYYLYC